MTFQLLQFDQRPNPQILMSLLKRGMLLQRLKTSAKVKQLFQQLQVPNECGTLLNFPALKAFLVQQI